MRRLAFSILGLILSLSGVAHADSDRRVALIVANATYPHHQALLNPLRDAKLIADSLRQAGFDTIDLRPDVKRAAFEEALHQFQRKADGAQVAVIYYAGHGIERNGENWLLPTDATLDNPTDLEYEAIRLDLLMHAVQGARLKVVAIDACRDNPFGRGWTVGQRGVSRGLNGVEADDVLILYAAAPGQVASDGSGADSPFASALARHLAEPGLALQLLGGVVRDDVLAATGGTQRPFVSASITGKPFYLVPSAPSASAAPVAAGASFDPRASELAYWNACCSGADATPTEFQAYLKRVEEKAFPGTYADLARRRLDMASAAPVPARGPAASAELAAATALPTAGSPVADAADAGLDEHSQKILRILQGHAGGRVHVYPDLNADLRASLGKWLSPHCMAHLLGFFDQTILANNHGNGIAFCTDGVEFNEFGQHTFKTYRELNGAVGLVDASHVRFNLTVIDTNWFPGIGTAAPRAFAEMLHAMVGAYLKG